MPRFYKRPSLIPIWVALAASIVGVVTLGWGRILSIAFLLMILGWLGYGAYLELTKAVLGDSLPIIQGNRLIQRNRAGRECGSVDLNLPFKCELVHHDGWKALYRVQQGHQRLQFVVPVTSDGRLVRDVLRMQWPPEATSAAQWMP